MMTFDLRFASAYRVVRSRATCIAFLSLVAAGACERAAGAPDSISLEVKAVQKGHALRVTLVQPTFPCQPLLVDTFAGANVDSMRPLTVLQVGIKDTRDGVQLRNLATLHREYPGLDPTEALRLGCDKHFGWTISLISGLDWKFALERDRSYEARVCAKSGMRSFFLHQPHRTVPSTAKDKDMLRDFEVCSEPVSFVYE